ncbi:Uncharacterized protein PODLI_1B003122, partial [Podarcis lilfordi]
IASDTPEANLSGWRNFSESLEIAPPYLGVTRYADVGGAVGLPIGSEPLAFGSGVSNPRLRSRMWLFYTFAAAPGRILARGGGALCAPTLPTVAGAVLAVTSHGGGPPHTFLFFPYSPSPSSAILPSWGFGSHFVSGSVNLKATSDIRRSPARSGNPLATSSPEPANRLAQGVKLWSAISPCWPRVRTSVHNTGADVQIVTTHWFWRLGIGRAYGGLLSVFVLNLLFVPQ